LTAFILKLALPGKNDCVATRNFIQPEQIRFFVGTISIVAALYELSTELSLQQVKLSPQQI